MPSIHIYFSNILKIKILWLMKKSLPLFVKHRNKLSTKKPLRRGAGDRRDYRVNPPKIL